MQTNALLRLKQSRVASCAEYHLVSTMRSPPAASGSTHVNTDTRCATAAHNPAKPLALVNVFLLVTADVLPSIFWVLLFLVLATSDILDTVTVAICSHYGAVYESLQ